MNDPGVGLMMLLAVAIWPIELVCEAIAALIRRRRRKRAADASVQPRS